MSLQVRDLWVAHDGVLALRGVSLTIEAGAFVGLVGPNGAGKSTLLRTITGSCHPARGSILLEGRDLLAVAPHDRVGQGIALVPEGRRVFGPMSVLENLELGAYSRRSTRMVPRLEKVFRLFPRLRERASQTASTLSGGEQQMLAVGRALMSDPKYLLLDEPLLGLAPTVRAEIMRSLSDLAVTGVAALLVEEQPEAPAGLINKTYVLSAGRVVLEGRPDEITQEQLIRSYLGGKAL